MAQMKRYTLILLCLFVVLGLWLRVYHLDYPPIGYHNMKENQYLPYTWFMYNTDDPLDYLRTRTFWAGLHPEGYFTQYELPIISWLILIPWKLFGIHLWSARIIIILFSLGCIPLLYLLTKRLAHHWSEHQKEFLALVTAFFFTIMPLAVFFGRNVQPETPGFLMILVYSLLFLGWRERYEEGKPHFLMFFLFSLSVLVALLFKIPYGIGLVVLLFFVPLKKLSKDRSIFLKLAALFVIVILVFPLWTILSKQIMPAARSVGTENLIQSFAEAKSNVAYVLSGNYFKESKDALKAFIKDNYTLWFAWLTVVGVLVAVFSMVWEYRREKLKLIVTPVERWIFASVVMIVVYVLIFATKTRGHSYYQMPFLFFVALSSSYALTKIGGFFDTITLRIRKKQIQLKYVEYVFLFAFLLLSFFSLQRSLNNQWNTLFIGEDVAGDFIREQSAPDERVFMLGAGSQNVGLLWSAQRYGTHEQGENVQEIQEYEQRLNFRWFFLYRDGLALLQQDTDLGKYIRENYKARQLGGVVQDNNFQVIYVILERGGAFDPLPFQSIQPVKARIYELTKQEIDFYTITQ